MDRHPGDAVVQEARWIAATVPGVAAIEKTVVRKTGPRYYIEIHVQADGAVTLDRAHAIGGHVKAKPRPSCPGRRGWWCTWSRTRRVRGRRRTSVGDPGG
ncbi:MAG: hypothetical protein IPJ78_16820 [Gemmatimonadetes bacterium]|nr:hypothetical protein [Gemmatimonadota bacterium]